MDRIKSALCIVLVLGMGCTDSTETETPSVDAESPPTERLDEGASPVPSDQGVDASPDTAVSDAGDTVMDSGAVEPPPMTDAVVDSGVVPPPMTACETACTRVVECLVARCAGYEDSAADGLQARCLDRCTPEIARNLTSRTCEENLRRLRRQDEAVDAACRPPSQGEGVNALYIGHSFGRPFAEQFTDFTVNAGIESHTQQIVFSGGASVAPRPYGPTQRSGRRFKQSSMGATWISSR